MEMDFEYFQIKKLMLQTLGAYKANGKIESFFKFPCFLPEL